LLEREGKRAAGGIRPRQPLLHLEGLDVGQSTILVALQPDAPSPRHLRYLLERENQHLAIVADGRDQFALHHRDGTRFVGHGDIEHLLALAGIGEALVLRHDKAATLGAGDQELAAALMTEYGDDVGLLLQVGEQTDRLTMSETTTVIGSRSTSASSIAARSCTGACAKVVRRLPSGVLGPNFVRTSLTSSAIFFHCSVSEPMRSLSFLRSVRSALSSCLISISSSLRRLRSRMLRMASACTSESLKVFISTGLGSSSVRMILMTLSRFK